jgi:hypothetical protein
MSSVELVNKTLVKFDMLLKAQTKLGYYVVVAELQQERRPLRSTSTVDDGLWQLSTVDDGLKDDFMKDDFSRIIQVMKQLNTIIF